MRGVSSYKPAALALAALLALIPSSLMAGAFTAGNLVVLTVGDATVPAGTGGGTAAAVNLLEFAPTGTGQSPIQSIALSTGAGTKLTQTANATAEGGLSLTSNGAFLMLAGYDTAIGTTPLVGGTSTRVIARVDQSGGVAFTSTDLGINATARSAASVDGTQIYMGTSGSTTNGIRAFTFGTSAGTGVVTNTARMVQVFNGQVYESLQASIVKTDTPLPTGSSTVTALPGVTVTGANFMGFVLLDRDASVSGVDTLYVADQTNGLLKFSFDGTNWTARGAVAGGITSITGVVNGANADLYVTSGTGGAVGNTLKTLTDTTAFNVDIGAPTYTTLATAAANTAFRGVAFAPVPEPGSLLLGGTVVVGALGAGLRRYLRRRETAIAE